MVAENHLTIGHHANSFSYADACRIAARIAAAGGSHSFFVDLSRTSRTTTAALARLILLRRELLESGRDLRILGLRGQPSVLCEILRLTKLLCAADGSACGPGQGPADGTPCQNRDQAGLFTRQATPATPYGVTTNDGVTTNGMKESQRCPL